MTMRMGIMQPYFFPYIGYFQLIHAVDVFVIYDDVNYIKQGWINRNRILLNNTSHMFTLNLIGASSFRLINQIKTGDNKAKLLKTIEQAYVKTPYYKDVMPILRDIFLNEETNLSSYLNYSILGISEYLGVRTRIIKSSEIDKQNDLKGQEKVIHICKMLNASKYINAIGGVELYSKERFQQENIELSFIRSNPLIYKQFTDEFSPWLSIIDVIMFNPKDSIGQMLNNIELI
jgi:hypothetical protein